MNRTHRSVRLSGSGRQGRFDRGTIHGDSVNDISRCAAQVPADDLLGEGIHVGRGPA